MNYLFFKQPYKNRIELEAPPLKNHSQEMTQGL